MLHTELPLLCSPLNRIPASHSSSACFYAVRMCIGPGDILYLPPYVWHHVASIDTSVSITSLSHDTNMRFHLDSVYRYDHKYITPTTLQHCAAAPYSL
jgi:hypothetical protein